MRNFKKGENPEAQSPHRFWGHALQGFFENVK
jgi:hypothetical protein